MHFCWYRDRMSREVCCLYRQDKIKWNAGLVMMEPEIWLEKLPRNLKHRKKPQIVAVSRGYDT